MQFKSVNLPKELYISSLDQLEVGMTIWSVGFGGVASPDEPYLLGAFIEVEGNTIRYLCDGEFVMSVSIADRNIGLLNGYNNWFICGSEEQANAATAFIKRAWEHDPHFGHYMAEKIQEMAWLDDVMDFEVDLYEDMFCEESEV